MTTPTPDSNDERDHAALLRMLDHAPDRAALPDARLRATILAKAQEALRQPPEDVPAAPWQRRLKAWLGLEGWSPSRGPRQAAFATIALAALVTLMWQHEPVPGSRLDGAPEASTPAPSAALPAPAAVQQRAPAPQKPEPAAAAPSSEKSQATRPRSEARADAKAAETVATEMSPPAAPVAPAPPAAPSAPMSLSVPGPTGSGGSAVAAAPVAPSAHAAAPAARARIAASPSFAALDAWTRLTVAQPDGRTRSLSREEAGALAALVDSAARSGASADVTESRVDWRITFERNGEAIATLELAGNAIRWREGGMPAQTGRPPPQLLEALRSALAQRLTGG